MEPVSIQIPPKVMAAMERNGTSSRLSMTAIDRERWLADQANKRPGSLEGPDCPECLNRGFFFRVDDRGQRYTQECKCMARRKSERNMARSGLTELLKRYTMENWEAREPWQKKLADMVHDYANNPSGWFLLSGTPGTGKTHLCTALCGMLMERGMPARYMLWRDVSVRAKACVNDEMEYQALIEPLKRVKVLYIDDLFKTGKGQQPTTGDVNLAFELINARYNDSRLLTVISSERSINEILDIDEGVGSRIYERAKEYYADLRGRKNWRMQ